MVVLLYLLFPSLLLYVNCDLEQTEDVLGELVFANVLFRHGDRTPVDPYPNDPYRNISYWPIGYGQLTNLGKNQHYELGKWLRVRYQNFLPSIYNKSDIYVQSTDVDRTLMSAESNLAGLYEPDSEQNWNKNIKWSPIPVHTIPEHSDYILAAKKPCPKYDKIYSKFLNSDVVQQWNRKYNEIFEYLTDKTGSDISDVTNVEYIYNTLKIEQFNNLTLPAWTSKVFPSPMLDISRLSFTLRSYYEPLARLKTGPLLGDMLKHFNKAISNETSRKMWVYSGHDTTIANLLQTLKVFEPHCPPYASTILLELRKLNLDYYVTLFYKNTTDSIQFLNIPGCEKNCLLSTFIKLTKSVVPVNWDKECIQTSKFLFINDTSNNVITLVSLFLFLILVFISMMLFYKKQNEHRSFLYHSLSMEQIS